MGLDTRQTHSPQNSGNWQCIFSCPTAKAVSPGNRFFISSTLKTFLSCAQGCFHNDLAPFTTSKACIFLAFNQAPCFLTDSFLTRWVRLTDVVHNKYNGYVTKNGKREHLLGSANPSIYAQRQDKTFADLSSLTHSARDSCIRASHTFTYLASVAPYYISVLVNL